LKVATEGEYYGWYLSISDEITDDKRDAVSVFVKANDPGNNRMRTAFRLK